MSVNEERGIAYGKTLHERLLHDVLAVQDETVERIVSHDLRARARINVDHELAIQNRVSQGIVERLPVREVQVVDGEVALLAVNLGSVLARFG